MPAGNALLRPLVNWVNRRPIDSDVTEAKYAVHVVCLPCDVSDVCDLLDAELDRASYPVREVETLSDSDNRSSLRPSWFRPPPRRPNPMPWLMRS